MQFNKYTHTHTHRIWTPHSPISVILSKPRQHFNKGSIVRILQIFIEILSYFPPIVYTCSRESSGGYLAPGVCGCEEILHVRYRNPSHRAHRAECRVYLIPTSQRAAVTPGFFRCRTLRCITSAHWDALFALRFLGRYAKGEKKTLLAKILSIYFFM